MELIQSQIHQWLQALEVERLHQQESFKSILLSKSIKERIKEGFTWHPLTLKSSGYAVGSIPFVVLEKQTESKSDDKFQSGRPVQVFRVQQSGADYLIKGIIHWINKRQIKIYLHSRELPEWISAGSIGVDLLYDEQSFIDMKNAMKSLSSNEDNVSARDMSSIIYGDQPLANDYKSIPLLKSNHLNDSQKSAISSALLTERLHVVHGPPGTGKTTTLVHLILELLVREMQILVCAPSNAAVDWITGLIHSKGVDTLRIGHLSRMDPEVMDCSLESKVMEKPEAKEIKKLRIKSEELSKLADQYKRSFGPSERLQRRLLRKEAKDLRDWAFELERRTVNDIIDQAQVICCTLTGTSTKYLKDRFFTTCIIDEAAQALQGACWMAMLKADKVILAGDPFQLPPTVKSADAAKMGLGITLLDLVIQQQMHVSLLNVQYRMNGVIMQFSNDWFYGGKLEAHASVVGHKLDEIESIHGVLEFIDTAGCGFYETLLPETRSYYNPDEYRLLREHLDPLIARQYPSIPEIGILSPYKAQVTYMRDKFQEDIPIACDLQIQTIDGFQGQEKDIIYISLVRSNDERQIGFLADYRRMNVALTRARKKLVIIGDSATLGNDPFYQKLLDYIDKNEAYRSAWEFIQSR